MKELLKKADIAARAIKYFALFALMCLVTFASAQPPRGPFIISPQINSDKTVTFRYLAPLAKEVKLSGQFQQAAVNMTKDSIGIWSITVGPIKPDIYPKVDDEATIIVTYPKAQGIIQASWNWPYNRKDMEVYGQKAYLKADRNTLTFRVGDEKETSLEFSKLSRPFDDPFAYFKAVIRNEITVSKTDLSSLDINLLVIEILEAARQSANEHKTIYLEKK